MTKPRTLGLGTVASGCDSEVDASTRGEALNASVSSSTHSRLYQVEVKLELVRLAFPPSAAWIVTVDVDPMERARGGVHPSDKSERAASALKQLKALGVSIGEHDIHGRADIVADHPELGRRIVEVEGDSSRQPDQAMYSALGQILLKWRGTTEHLRYGLAVPNSRRWRQQLVKIPSSIRELLGLELYLVGPGTLTTLRATEAVIV